MINSEGTSTILDVLDIKPNYSELGRVYGMVRRTAKKKHLGMKIKNEEERRYHLLMNLMK